MDTKTHLIGDLVSKREYRGGEGTNVEVFQYWTVQGKLITEIVPTADEYNLTRYRVDGRTAVGRGCLVALQADPSRFGSERWRIEFVRTADTPRNPYTIGWHIRWRWNSIPEAVWLAKHENLWLGIRKFINPASVFVVNMN